MVEIINIIILLFIGVIAGFNNNTQSYFIIPFLTIIIFVSIALAIPKYRKISYIYLALTIFFPEFLPFLSCSFYILTEDKNFHIYNLLFLIPYILYDNRISACFLLITLGIAYILKIRYLEESFLRIEYLKQRDNSKELADLLTKTNKSLLIRQEQEIHIATLNERNRIAREIHDHVGHLLSSALLQIGAIETINTQENMRDAIRNLKVTISNGMDNVRNSVHDLHDDALDIEVMINKLCKEFTFCCAEFEYDVFSSISTTIYYHILAIVKEAMNNTMKHSNATHLQITLREQTTFYQLIIHDNGTLISKNNEGIGLKNMGNRVETVGGFFNIDTTTGFQIFITIPKEEQGNESINY